MKLVSTFKPVFLIASLGSCSDAHSELPLYGLVTCKERNKYETAVDEYFKNYNKKESLLPLEWPKWVKGNYDRFCDAFDRTKYFIEEKDKTASVQVFYYNNIPLTYKNPWPSEEEHMSTLELLLELTFPGWNFKVLFGGEYNSKKQYESDFVIHLNFPYSASFQSGNAIYLSHEATLAHEMAHLLGLNHHYDTTEVARKGTNMAPEETKCLMDATSYQLGSPDRFALDIPLDVDNGEGIKNIISEIKDRSQKE